MASRAELEQEWQEFQLWRQSQSLEFTDYLEHRDLQIAKENIETLREVVSNMDDEDTLTAADLKELLNRV